MNARPLLSSFSRSVPTFCPRQHFLRVMIDQARMSPPARNDDAKAPGNTVSVKPGSFASMLKRTLAFEPLASGAKLNGCGAAFNHAVAPPTSSAKAKLSTCRNATSQVAIARTCTLPLL